MQRGEHIKIRRSMGYYHHGILTSPTVIHFTGEPDNKGNAEIKQTSLDDFIIPGTPDRIERVAEGGENAASTAEHYMRHYNGRGMYSLVHFNCEHFATYCVTEKWSSEQAIKCLKWLYRSNSQETTDYDGVTIAILASTVFCVFSGDYNRNLLKSTMEEYTRLWFTSILKDCNEGNLLQLMSNLTDWTDIVNGALGNNDNNLLNTLTAINIVGTTALMAYTHNT